MHITRFTDLSLRVLMYLCARPSQELATVTEIAERIGWTRNHVVKVVHRLSKEGWLITQRGRSGGLEIHPEARKLKLGAVVRRLEGDNRLIDCAEPPCTFGRSCPLIGVLADAQEAFYQTLDAYVLEDVAKPGAFAHLYSAVLPAGAAVIPIAAVSEDQTPLAEF